jgi:hypothetical protein
MLLSIITLIHQPLPPIAISHNYGLSDVTFVILWGLREMRMFRVRDSEFLPRRVARKIQKGFMPSRKGISYQLGIINTSKNVM